MLENLGKTIFVWEKYRIRALSFCGLVFELYKVCSFLYVIISFMLVFGYG